MESEELLAGGGCQEHQEPGPAVTRSGSQAQDGPAAPLSRWNRADLALRKACQNADLFAMRFALARGAGMCADKSGKTALHYATRVGFYEGVRELLVQGFDPNIIDCHGGRPVDEAETWSAKASNAAQRKACLDCRDCLVSFHGRRCDPHERDDTATFLHRRRSLQDMVRNRDGQHAHIPWEDDLDRLDVLLNASGGSAAASSASTGRATAFNVTSSTASTAPGPPFGPVSGMMFEHVAPRAPSANTTSAAAGTRPPKKAAQRQRLWGDVVSAYKYKNLHVRKSSTADATPIEPVDPRNETVYL